MILHPERRFYFALAEKLGMTVGEMLHKISSTEITEWAAYYRIESIEYEQRIATSKLEQSIRG